MVRYPLKRVIMPGMLLLAFLIAGCTANVGLVPPEQMSPRELATYSMRVYNQIFDNVMQKAALPNLSDAEKTVLKTQKKWLDGAWPVIRTYNFYIEQGQMASMELRQQLITYLNTVRY
jgi:hypothetical protein